MLSAPEMQTNVPSLDVFPLLCVCVCVVQPFAIL